MASVTYDNTVYPVARDVLGQAHADRVVLGVRPEDLEVSERRRPIEVDVVEELGADAYVYGRTRLGDGEHQMIARVDGRRPPAAGDVFHVTPRRGHVHLFHVASGERLG